MTMTLDNDDRFWCRTGGPCPEERLVNRRSPLGFMLGNKPVGAWVECGGNIYTKISLGPDKETSS